METCASHLVRAKSQDSSRHFDLRVYEGTRVELKMELNRFLSNTGHTAFADHFSYRRPGDIYRTFTVVVKQTGGAAALDPTSGP